MKLLFDQKISFKVAKKIQSEFPESKHLSDLIKLFISDKETSFLEIK
jgi:predicted nuclease of predicted toxin-antitoxin system